MKRAFEKLLERHDQLQIRRFSFEIYAHKGRDPGVYRTCQEFLRPVNRNYGFALVVFDREGCGAERKAAELLEREVENRLARNGWHSRCAAIVIDPELEAWVWQDSEIVARRLRLSRSVLRSLLGKTGKPRRPKETLEAALRSKGIARSAAFYQKLAESADFGNCKDRAFNKFLRTLQTWFPLVGV